MKKKLSLILFLSYFLSVHLFTSAMSIGFYLLIVSFFLLENPFHQFKQIILKDKKLRLFFYFTLIFAGYLIFTVLRSKFWMGPVFGEKPEVQALFECTKVIYFLAPFLAVIVLMNFQKEIIWKAFHFQWILCLFMGAIAVLEYFTGWPKGQPLVEQSGRFAATLLMGLSLSVSSNMSLPLYPALSLGLKNLKENKLPFFASLSCILIVYLTFSRTSFISIPLGVCFLLILRLRLKFALIFSSVLIGFFILLFSVNGNLKGRITSSGGIQDRIALWKGNIHLFKEEPLFGVGFRQASKLVVASVKDIDQHLGTHYSNDFGPAHAHNNFLEMMSNTGLLGLLFFLIFNAFILGQLILGMRKEGEFQYWMSGAFVSFIVFHLNGLTQVNFWDAKVFPALLQFIGLVFVINKWSFLDRTKTAIE